MTATSSSAALDHLDDVALAERLSSARGRVVAELRKIIVGQDAVIEQTLVALLAGGNCLIIGVPGLAKTLLVHSLAQALDLKFSRIQFTPDLMPTDVTGTDVIRDDPATGRRHLVFMRGPIFANVVLADEINRTTPKTQSALFEAMEERQVTVDGCTRELPRPFLVIATQNPFDYHGTFHLPDSQLDRFLMRLSIGYPDRGTERAILRTSADRRVPDAAIGPADVMALLAEAARIEVPELVEEYLLDIVRGTRSDARFVRGVSTRGAQALHRAVRAWALVSGRRAAVPEDVRAVAVPVLAHRVLPRSGGGPGGDGGAEAIGAVLDEIPPPL